MVSFGVLGPLTAVGERGPIPLKGPRHRAVLARLLVARGRVVPVPWLVGDLWEEPGQGAVGAVQTFVGALRKALEPDRPPRTPSRLLVTSPPGYALRAEPDAVDAWRFESALTDAASRPAAEAYRLLDAALKLWRGPAYAEFADQDWARGEAARLDELRLLAVERRAEAGLAAGLAAECVADLEAHVSAHPLREDGWHLLARSLYATGRQGDALGTLRRARNTLLTELGVDPGEPLRALESDILSQAPHLTPPPAKRPTGPSERAENTSRKTPAPEDEVTALPVAHLAARKTAAPGAQATGLATAHLAAGAPEARATGLAAAHFAVAEHPFVGRHAELAELGRAAACVATSGRSRLVLISGAAGAGKTALVDTLARRLRATGWQTAPPTCETLETVVVAAREAPVLLVFDDLHEADEETLAVFARLATGLGPARVLIVGTYRSTDLTIPLTEALGRAARAEPVRVYLGGLTESEVRELVGALATREPVDAHIRTIQRRSAGNPFFVRELTRLWESDGDAALHTVPAGVRDVIRHRLAGLPGAARTHLRQAAVIGQEVDLDVLTELAGDEDAVLDSVESALLAGFLVERDADRLRFAHALVQETLYDDVARARRARWHAAVAGIVERTRPGEVETIAHHCVRSEGRAGDLRTARYARAAAERAEHRSAPHEAARLWHATLTALDRAIRKTPTPSRTTPAAPDRVAADRTPSAPAGPDRAAAGHTSSDRAARDEAGGSGLARPSGWEEAASSGSPVSGGGTVVAPHPEGAEGTLLEERLVAVMGLGRALAVTGRLQESRRLRAEAVDVAEVLGDPLLTATVIGSFDVPANWTTNDDPALSERLVAAAERTLAALPDDTTSVSLGRYAAERARLLITIAMERRADPGRRADQAAREAESIARRLGDRTLLAYALNGRALQTFHRAGLAPERAAIGEELLTLAAAAPPAQANATDPDAGVGARADSTGAGARGGAGAKAAECAGATGAGAEAAECAGATGSGTGAAERAGAGVREGMVTFAVLGHLVLLQARAGMGDLAAADRHAAAADRLAEQYDLPLVGVFTTWYAALRLAVTSGDRDAARAAYRAAAARLDGASMPGVEQGLLPLALVTLDVIDAGSVKPSQAPPIPTRPGLAQRGLEWGPYEEWVRPLVLLAEGRSEQAREAVRAVPESPRDLLYELRTCLHATAALAAGVTDHLQDLYDRLLPARDELAGAGSGLVTLGPVALYLGRLAAALDRPDLAEEHFRQATAVAARAKSPHWAATAKSAVTAKDAHVAMDAPIGKDAPTA
ncbi:BTAD domain-containing putative transcriptional regulator [Nonomuraea sp. NPDC049419]|uniref:BTAD domain-containing putative transcriptional regulator n=1 Tax=Nonomuraea sp. NPDC049419 TaxID=3155772 RepID=UPI00341D4B9E